MAVPLIVRGEPSGAVAFASAESGRVFDRDDLSLAGGAGRAGGRDRERAPLPGAQPHRTDAPESLLLPPRLPDMPGSSWPRATGAAEANDVGGDFYDVFPTGERTWGVVVGDVLGRGQAPRR